MNTAISQEQQDLYTQVDQARGKLAALEKQLADVSAELDGFSDQSEQYALLESACESLEKLAEKGAGSLFWGEGAGQEGGTERLSRAREKVAHFQEQMSGIRQRREKVEKELQQQQDHVEYLQEEIREAQAREERRKDEFVIDREVDRLPHRYTVMPWYHNGEDDRRFILAVVIALILSILLAGLAQLWELPPKEEKVVEVDERLAKLVKKKKPKPPPQKPKKKDEQKPKDKDKKKKPSKKKPTEAEKTKARKKAEGSGVLAFKDTFSDILDNSPDAKLGAKARVSNKGKTSGKTRRNIVAQEAQSTSGGINTASVSRNVSGSAGKGIGGVKFSRVDSSIGTDMSAGADRPLSDGPGPSRTDEELQIVFDRYKSALYRIYNRQLRRNPTLQGKMVLRITIQPDGSVSACKVESTDMDSPALSRKVVARVKRFNFGPKKGVPPVTIRYPIDFLPAS